MRTGQGELATRRRMLANAAGPLRTSCFHAERPEQWPTRSKRDLANVGKMDFYDNPPTGRERGSPRPSTGLQCLALPRTSFDMTSEQSRQRLADFGCFMRVAHRNAPDYRIDGLLDFWQIFGKTVF